MKKVMSLKTGSYFEWHMKIAGAVFILVGIAWISQNLIGGALLIIAGLSTFLINYHFTIDTKEKVYQDGLTIFGLKLGRKNKYQSVEYLFLKTGKASRTYNSRIQSSIITYLEFNGYIRFSEDKKVHLISAKAKQDAIDKLVPLSNFLNVQIVDYTLEVTDVN
jgi:hypothetical protein